MKKIYLLMLVMFSFVQMKGQGCVMTYAYDSTSATYTFVVNPTSSSSVFNWDFGDGINITSGPAVMHNFAIPDSYLVCVNEFDTALQIVVSSCCQAVTNLNSNTCAWLAVTANGNDYDFTAVANNLTNILWDFSDGTFATGATTSHSFPVAGTYTICMTSISFADTCNYCATIVVNGPPPPCTFTYTIDTVAPLVAYFNYTPSDTNNLVSWDFGSGNTITGTNIMYQFAGAGIYQVCATETNALGNTVCYTCNNVSINPSLNCTFTAMPGMGPLNTFYFNASFDTTLYLANWNFGDGTTVNLDNNFETHTYATSGIYNACMDLVDLSTMNVVCSYCSVINIAGPVPCDANFTVVPFGLDAYFIDYSTADPSVTTYLWNFGDGNFSTDRFPVHTYATPGTYSVGFSINNSTCDDSTYQTIVVDTNIITPVFCTSYFIFTQLSPYQLAVVNLSSGTNLSFAWDFGDGNTSTAAYPIHNYNTHGTFLICLTVADASGCTNTYCDSLTVDSMGMITYRNSNVGFTINVVSPTQLNTVSIEENSALISDLYPNPSMDRIVVTSPPKSAATVYSILSASGQQVLSGKISGDRSEINISEISSGIYFLEVKTKDGARSFARFIKQ